MTLDKSHCSFPEKPNSHPRFLDEFFQDGEKVLFRPRPEKVIDLKAQLFALALVKADMPKGVDTRDVNAAAGQDNDNGPKVRYSLAIQILQTASKMDTLQDRKDEIAKLKVLFRLGLTDRDIDLRNLLKPLTDKDSPSQEDCLAALKTLEAAKEEKKADADKYKSIGERAIALIKKAQTIAYPDDREKELTERKKLLEQAAELYNLPKSRQTAGTAFMYWQLKNPTNPRNNAELDGYLSMIERDNPFNPSRIEAPYYRTLHMMTGLLQLKIEERRKLLESFKEDESYKGDEKIQKVVDGLLETRLTDLDIQTYVRKVAYPTFFPQDTNIKPPGPGNEPWYLSPWFYIPGGIVTAVSSPVLVGLGMRAVKELFLLGWKPERWFDRSNKSPTDSTDVASRIRDDKMSAEKTKTQFKSEAETAFKGLDPGKNPTEAGKKLGKFMTDFALVENLDARLGDGKLKVKVEFTTEAVEASSGMHKARIAFVIDGDTTTMKMTFPADATPAEMAHDCHMGLYELERSGKGGGKALTATERAQISRQFTNMGVDVAREGDTSRRTVAEALPDRTPVATPEPVIIRFAEDGVSIGKTKYAVDEVAKAVRDELKDKLDKLKDEGKKDGDKDYDQAKKDLAEHDTILKNLASDDAGTRETARKAAVEKVKTAFEAEDGKLAKRFSEDLRRGGGDEKGRSRAVVLAMFAQRFVTPTAVALIGLGVAGSARGSTDTPVRRAPIVPIVPKKKP